MSLAASLMARTPFSAACDADAELRQLAVLRWCTGLICLARTTPIVWASLYYHAPAAADALPSHVTHGLWILLLIGAVTVGFAAPITLPWLAVSYTRFDDDLNTSTLGTDLLCLLLALFLFTGAGARWSVDAWLLRARRIVGSIWRTAYGMVGLPTARQFPALLLLFFSAYAVMSFGALLYHLQDDAWLSGELLQILFTSSYLCRFWEPFRTLEAAAPGALQTLSAAGAIGQAIFQAFMLLLIWTRWGARIVVAWGTLFFLMSLFLLQLSYLPVLEILLWIALFNRPAGNSSTPPAFARSPQASAVFAWSGAAVLLAFTVTSLPYLKDLVNLQTDASTRAFRMAGLEIPNVFNRADLRMGDVWPVISREGSDAPLPYHGWQGERLTWVQWNDLFYFGNSLRWRREYRGLESLARTEDGFSRLSNVALFDHRRRGADASTYRVQYFATRGSDASIDVRTRFLRQQIGADLIACHGTGIDARCE